MPFDDDGEEDLPGFRPPPPPGDRLWRHPSELTQPLPGGPPFRGITASSLTWGLAAAAATSCVVLAAAAALLVVSGQDRQRQPIALSSLASLPTRTVGPGFPVGRSSQLEASIVAVEISTPQRTATRGTGLILHDNGTVLTSAALFTDKDGGATTKDPAPVQITVRLPSGGTLPAELVGTDPVTLLAVLDLAGSDHVPASLGGPTAIEPSDRAVIVSALDRSRTRETHVVVKGSRARVAAGAVMLDGVIEMNAGDQPATLGSPVVDAEGVVVGIVAWLDLEAAYATPADVAAKVGEDILKRGRANHCWLGITGLDATSRGAGTVARGALVNTVVPDSPAERAGLHAGDTVVAIDDRPVDDMPTLVTALRLHSPGDRIAVGVTRAGKPFTLGVTLGKPPP